MHTENGAPRSRLALAGLSLCVFAAWMLYHPYGGIEYNDSSLYALLALARLHPQSLAGDVFLRFGSQDHYTIFGPLFAAAIRLLDLEPAAAVLTLAGQAAFFASAWLLARGLMPARQALLAIGLLVVLPSTYGVDRMFSYVEDFLTPRQLAEALVVASLAAALSRRYVLCGTSLLAAMFIHPIMGAVGFVMLFCRYVAIPRPKLAALLAAALLVTSLAAVVFFPGGPLDRFDATWLNLTRGATPYLFVTQWAPGNWGRAAIPVAVLAVGALTNTAPEVRKLCVGALLTAVCGVTVMLIYVDTLHVVIFTQMQSWRWQWLVEVLAVVLLPLIAGDCLRRGIPGRTAVVLLVSALALRDYPITLFIAALAVVCVPVLDRLGHARPSRWIFVSSCALLTLALTLNFAQKLSYVALNETGVGSASVLSAPWLRIWSGDGLLGGALLVLACRATEPRASPRGAVFVAGVASVACAILAPLAWQSWTTFHYTARLRAAFEQWRDAIPQRAEVAWPGTPVGAWYLLERQSYYSLQQVAGDLFSRAKALEIHRRAASIEAALSGRPQESRSAASGSELPGGADNLTRRGLVAACTDSDLAFVVSRSDLGPTPFEAVAPDRNQPRRRLHLYPCARPADSVTLLRRSDLTESVRLMRDSRQ